MNASDNLLKQLRPQILAKASEYGIHNVRIAHPKMNGSLPEDIILVVDYPPNTGWNFFLFSQEVEDLLHRDVRVLTSAIASDERHKPYIDSIVPL